jgi:carboxypeptidase C (cathepsin A)
MSEEAGKNWKRPKEEAAAFQGYVDVAPALARGMADNPALRVFVASGLYDIATTFFAAEYSVRRSTMDRARVVLKRYPAGHMMYVHGPTFVELSRNMREFVARPVRKEGTGSGN